MGVRLKEASPAIRNRKAYIVARSSARKTRAIGSCCSFRKDDKVLLLFLSLLVIGIAGYVLFADLWIRYVFAHIGGLAVIGLIACWAGAIAKKKGRGYWGAFFLGLVTPIMLGISSVGVVHTLGGRGCGGIVSLSVAIAVILYYSLVKKRGIA